MSQDAQSDFGSFGLHDALIKAVDDLGFEVPTPIQHAAIGPLMQGRDVIGSARTGSGKTAAFGLPLLQRVRDGGPVRALVLTPTRELALQVSDALASFAAHLDLEVLTIYGGASYKPQLRGLRRGATVVVGTPGRVLDLMDRGALDLANVEYFVLDEGDEMLRMGFVEDVERVLAVLPEARQIALFSATMPAPIRRLAQQYLSDPHEIQVEEETLSTGHIEQSFIRVGQRHKERALLRLLAAKPPGATLVFVRTRNRCGEVAEFLIEQGISADALHGDLNQGARERVLSRLRSRSLDIVVATDVAARGIDVDHLSCVINFDIPDDAEVYTHRIGRTARAGRAGTAITLVAPRDAAKAKQIRRELAVDIEDGRLPSNEQIAHARQEDIVDQLEAVIGTDECSAMRSWLQDVTSQRSWDPEDVAAAAVHLLGLELNFEFAEEPPPVAFDDKDFAAINETEIVLRAGRRDGLRPADIVGTLANDIGIAANQIGKISLGANRAFVGLPKAVADLLLEQHPTISMRGNDVRVELNTGQTTAGPSDGPDKRESRPITTKPPKKKRSKGRDKNKGAPGRHKKRKNKKQ